MCTNIVIFHQHKNHHHHYRDNGWISQLKNPHNLPLHHVHCTLRVEVHDHGEDHGEDHDDDHGEDHDDDEFDEIIIMGTLIIHDDHDGHADYEDHGDAH